MKQSQVKGNLKKQKHTKSSDSFEQSFQTPRKTLKSGKFYNKDEIAYQSDDNGIEVNNSNQKDLKTPHTNQPKACPKKNKQISKRNRPKTSQVNQLQNDLSQVQSNYNKRESIQSKMIPKRKRLRKSGPLIKLFYTQDFIKLSEIDFKMYFKTLSRKKLFSTLLVNQYGNVIFADRLASQHFQGSLNNFQKNPIQTMVLECKMGHFYSKTQKVTKQNFQAIKMIIYSKNSKRRYSKRTNSNGFTTQDIFHRFLKCISTKITPIEITFTSYQKYEGYWNINLVKLNQPLKCFLLRTRLSKKMPKLQNLTFQNDKKIKKFIEYTKRKQNQVQMKSSKLQNEEVISPIKSEEQFKPKRKFKPFDQQKYYEEDEIIYEEINNEDAKHSKSTTFRLLNSGQGKRRKK